ncbi:Neopullulanase [hydrothermal vent metagenome]|uniref:Neopullulanase n=1 Tax=hydrothermal vent metagenome TaxID=652676 RepID=A0A3B0S9D3_9ZZZZ
MKQIKILLTVFLALFLVSTSHAQNNIDRVEPPFWWVGFKETSLQLLVHGPEISGYLPNISYPGVSISNVIRVQSPNYLFIDVMIAPETQAGKFNISFINEDGAEISYGYELKAREENSASRRGFNSSDAIYLITPDRFANGNAGNDTVAGLEDKLDRKNIGGRHGGDIQGISDHLDYISDMGFTSVWLNPVLENAQPTYSYHGYATTDFYKVDPRFGTNEEFRAMIEKARSKGIGFIMDMIANHSGSEHWWMKDMPSDDWINYTAEYRAGKYVNTSHRRTLLRDPYSSDSDKKLFSDGWFVETMPDLNQKNPLMAKYLIQNAVWWIEYSGLTGIRMDTYPYSDMNFMSDWTGRIMNEYPDFNIVGEEWSINPSVVSYWQRGKVNRNGYVSHLPSLMDFPLNLILAKSLNDKEEWSRGLIEIYKMLANDADYPDPANLVIFPDNHDMSRIFTQLNEDEDLYRMAIAFNLTMRGIPQIYYGTEILMSNPGTDDHGIIRSDFPGGWAGDEVNAFTGEGLSAAQSAAQEFTRRLLNWRKKTPVIHKGKLMHFVPENGVYVYFRYDDQDKVMVVINKNAASYDLSLDRFAEMLEGEKRAKDIITGALVELTDNIDLAARSVMILEIE